MYVWTISCVSATIPSQRPYSSFRPIDHAIQQVPVPSTTLRSLPKLSDKPSRSSLPADDPGAEPRATAHLDHASCRLAIIPKRLINLGEEGTLKTMSLSQGPRSAAIRTGASSVSGFLLPS